jgi:hypothetical protein
MSFTREGIDLEAIRAPIAGMSDSELLKYGQSAAWMAEHSDRATWRVQLAEAMNTRINALSPKLNVLDIYRRGFSNPLAPAQWQEPSDRSIDSILSSAR